MGAGSPSILIDPPAETDSFSKLPAPPQARLLPSSLPLSVLTSQFSSFLPVSCIYLGDQSAFIFFPRHLVCSVEEKQQRDFYSFLQMKQE